MVQHIPEQENEKKHDRDNRIAMEKLENRRALGNVLAADRLVRRIKEVGGKNDLPGAQCHDKGRQLHMSDQCAVEPAAQGATGEAANDGNWRRNSIAECELAHDDRRQDHDGANRKVDAGG